MIKKILIGSSVLFALSGCTQVVGQLSQVIMSSGSTSSLSNQAASQIANASSGQACIPRMSGGSTSLTQMITKKTLEVVINKALESVVGNKNIKLPKRINDTCQADRVLAYVSKLSKDFDNDIVQADQDILASLEQTKEIQHLRAQQEHKAEEAKSAEASVIIGDDKKAKELIKNAKIKDKAKYSKAMGKLAIAAPVSGYVLVGWDKEILEFAKDNMVWGVQNVMAIKDVASQLKTTVSFLPSLASLATSPLYNGRVNKSIAEKAAAEAEGQW